MTHLAEDVKARVLVLLLVVVGRVRGLPNGVHREKKDGQQCRRWRSGSERCSLPCFVRRHGMGNQNQVAQAVPFFVFSGTRCYFL